MFTCLRRRHYNKAPLVWINMCAHWGKYSKQLYELLQNYITTFDEYPVENTHSILRAQTNASDTAEQLRKKAKTIFQSKESQAHFRSFFTTPKHFSYSHSRLRSLKCKCAQVLTLMIKKIFKSPPHKLMNTKNKAPPYINLPTMFSNMPVKDTVLPLGFHGKVKPDPTKVCDLPGCQVQTSDDNWLLLPGCFHSFHEVCLNGSTFCPLCKDFLQKKIKDLGEIAKEAIINPASCKETNETENNTEIPENDTMMMKTMKTVICKSVKLKKKKQRKLSKTSMMS